MKRLLLVACLLSVLLSGCSADLPEAERAQEEAEGAVGDLVRAAQEITEDSVLGDVPKAGGADDEREATEQDGAFTETETAGQEGTFPETETASQGEMPPDGIGSLPDTGYDYTQLSGGEQQLYMEILGALREQRTDVPVSTAEEAVFEKVFQCVMDDHPEIFYVDGYTFIKYTKGDTVKGNAFSGSYIYDAQEIAQRWGQIQEETERILAGVPDTGEYEKVRYIYEYLITNTEYVQGSEDNQNICSVFLNGKSVCQGYAKAAQFLFRLLGLESAFVTGKVESGEDHAWNVVKIDGAYYHVDTTWGDASYVVNGSDSGYDGKLPEINYEYLCVPDGQLFGTHTVLGPVPIPPCRSMEANYYVREGAYFTEADMDKVAQLFKAAYESGTEYVTLKCADRDVYEEMESRLIQKQEVFRYLHMDDGTVAYTTNASQLALSFWL